MKNVTNALAGVLVTSAIPETNEDAVKLSEALGYDSHKKDWEELLAERIKVMALINSSLNPIIERALGHYLEDVVDRNIAHHPGQPELLDDDLQWIAGINEYYGMMDW